MTRFAWKFGIVAVMAHALGACSESNGYLYNSSKAKFDAIPHPAGMKPVGRCLTGKGGVIFSCTYDSALARFTAIAHYDRELPPQGWTKQKVEIVKDWGLIDSGYRTHIYCRGNESLHVDVPGHNTTSWTLSVALKESQDCVSSGKPPNRTQR